MGLSNALGSALSGLRTTQTGLELVATNIANEQTPGYTKKTLTQGATILAGRSAGVRVTEINREIDTYVQRQLRTESSGLSYSGIAVTYLDNLQRLFGTPGNDMSLDSLVSGFTSSLDALATTPSSQSARSDVLSEAQLLAQSLNSMSSDIQAMREDADRGLQDTVERANAALQGLATIQQRINSQAGQSVPPDYLDQRDQYIAELSGLMDIRVTENGNDLSIYTSSGASLFTNSTASTLEYSGSRMMSPEALYSPNPDESRLGTVYLRSPSGAKTDLLAPGQVRSGALKAYADIRDDALVEAQTQLDELAASMAEALGTREVSGIPTTSGGGSGFAVDLTDLAAGNKLSLTYTDTATGRQRTVNFVRVDDPASLPLSNDLTSDPNDQVVGIDFSGGWASVVSQMQTALGAQFQVSSTGSNLTVVDAGLGSGVTVDSLDARVTATALTGSGEALPFFVDGGLGGAPYTGSVDGLGQKVGFAGRIQVNAALTADPALLVNFNPPAVGDATRPTFLRDALENATRTYDSDTGLGGPSSPFSGSIADFARGIIEQQGQNAALAQSINEGQQVVVTSLQDRFADKSSVDVDEEMGKLLQLQTSYAANARVISTVQEMMDILLQM